MTENEIFPLVAGARPTPVTESYTYGDSSITLMSMEYIPPAPNYLTVNDPDGAFITIRYSTKEGNVLSGLSYVEGDTEFTFVADRCVAGRCINKCDDDARVEAINSKVDKVEGKGLSTEDFTSTLKTKLNGIEVGAEKNVIENIYVGSSKINPIDKTVTIPITSNDTYGAVKIGSGIVVENGVISTEDVIHSYNELTDKPSIESVELTGNKTAGDLGLATSDELEAKQDKLPQTAIQGLILKSTNVAGQVEWSQSGTTTVGWGDITGNITNQADLQTALEGKVSTSPGKGLSTNDYTSEDKILVGTIDNKVDKISGKGLSSNDYTTAEKEIVANVTSNLANKVDKDGSKVLSDVNFSTALKSKLDGIESGANVNVQADWEEDDTESDAYILNRPTFVSEFINDVEYQTETEVASSIVIHDVSTTSHSDIRGLISAEVTARTTADSGLQSQIDALEAKGIVTDLVGTYAELLQYDVSKLTVDNVIQVLQDETHSNAVGYYKYIGGAQPTCWTFTGSTAETYTKTQADARFALQTTTVNTYPLSSSIVLTASDVGALADDTTLADLSGDSTHRLVTDTQITSWTNKVDSVTGKGLSTNDYTDTAKGIVDGVTTALEGKVDKVEGKGLSKNDYTDADKTIVSGVTTALNGKVDKVDNKGLSTEDFTTVLKTKLEGIDMSTKVNVNQGLSEAGKYLKVDSNGYVTTGSSSTLSVDWGNIEGTLSNQTDLQNELDGKQDVLTFDNTPTESSSNPVKSGGVYSALSGKVDKDGTKVLSSNDFTDTLLAKLNGIESGAEVNVQVDWEEDDTESDAYILNKPTIPDVTNLVPNTRKVNGQPLSADVTITIPTKVSDLTNDSGFLVESDIEGKVDKEEGKGLSTNDFTDYYEGKLDSIHEGAEVNVQSDWTVTDTTSDAYIKNKPSSFMPVQHAVTHTNGADDIQTATGSQKGLLSSTDWNTFNNKQDELTFDTVPTADSQNVVSSGVVYTALSGKVNVVSGKQLSTEDFTTALMTKLEGVESGAEVNEIDVIKVDGVALDIEDKTVDIDLSGKVDVVSGKGLSTNDFTDALETKLEGISSGAEVNDIVGITVDSQSVTPVNRVVNIDLSGKVNVESGKGLSTNDFTDDLETKLNGIASNAQVNVLESVKVNGTAQTISDKAVNITVPTKVSDLTNDSSFATTTNVSTTVSTHNSANDSHSDIRTSISSEVSRAEGRESALQSAIDALASKTDVVDVVGTYAELEDYDTSTLHNNDIIKVLVDETHDDAISYYRWVNSSFTYVGSQGPFYTKEEADDYFVPQQRTINGKALTGNVTLTASDVSALPSSTVIPSTLAGLSDDSTHRLVTDTEKSTWNAKQSALTFDDTPTQNSSNPVKSGGVYTALAGKVSAVSGYGLSKNDFTDALLTKLNGIESGAQVNVKPNWNASAGSTAEILNKPTIPTAVSQLTNDSGFLTSVAYGTTSGTACEGNDSRLSNARTPTAHNHSASEVTSGTFDVSRIPSLTKSKISDFPTSMNPTSHVSTHKSGGSDALYSVSSPSLSVAGWSNKSQTVSVSGVTTTNTVIVAPVPASIDEWTGKGVKCTAQGSGTLTFTCDEVPTSAISVNVMVML